MAGVIRAELLKLVTTRLWLWVLLASAGITVLYAVLDVAFANTQGTWTLPLSTVEGQRTLLAVGGAAAPLMAVLGGIGTTGEFRHRTATPTFLATPRRTVVCAAKFLAYGVTSLGYALVGIAVTLAVGVPWLAVKRIHWVIGAGTIVATVAGVLAAMMLFAVLGVGLGALLRDQVATVVALLIYLLVVEKVLTSVHALDSVTVYLPGSALEALPGSTLTNQPLLAPWQAGLVLIGYALLAGIAGVRATARRDVV